MSICEDEIPTLAVETSRNAPLKVFVDASLRDGVAACGIVFKSHVGKILGRYNQILGTGYDIKGAEQAALDKAIHIAADMDGVEHVSFHTDRLDIAEGTYSLPQFEYARVSHVPREKNKAAHLQAGGAIVGLP